jgi:hypothetical protein
MPGQAGAMLTARHVELRGVALRDLRVASDLLPLRRELP